MTRSLREGEDVQLYSFFNSSAICGCVVNATHGPLYPRERSLSSKYYYSVLLTSNCLCLCSFVSSKTSSSQRVLGLPIGLLYMGFYLLIFCTILSSAVRSTWSNQFNLCFLINPIIFFPFSISFLS